ncbi:MAG: hypothetical protein EVA29_01425 [Candidatus Actinomarinales bacterium]|nr:MAG: hypothetical protein EVA29_01425 [Candidatus Actinomarinales bacterium]
MEYIKVDKVLTFQGEDAVSFLDSLISNEFVEGKIVPSFLLFPDGKINYWFLTEQNGEVVNIYQKNEELVKIKETFEKYKIRIKCEIEIKDIDVNLKIDSDTFEAGFDYNYKGNDLSTWDEITLNTELPTLETIENGLLPNETKWLLTFLNFEKGCFLGQEPVSRVNFRGRPRRKLITNKTGAQEFIKI